MPYTDFNNVIRCSECETPLAVCEKPVQVGRILCEECCKGLCRVYEFAGIESPVRLGLFKNSQLLRLKATNWRVNVSYWFYQLEEYLRDKSSKESLTRYKKSLDFLKHGGVVLDVRIGEDQ